jgi:hypothetical protein
MLFIAGLKIERPMQKARTRVGGERSIEIRISRTNLKSAILFLWLFINIAPGQDGSSIFGIILSSLLQGNTICRSRVIMICDYSATKSLIWKRLLAW